MTAPRQKPSKRRLPALALLDVVIPQRVTWLSSAGLAHPEAARMPELPFVWASGRYTIKGRGRAGDEARLLIEALLEKDPDLVKRPEAVAAAMTAYARWIVANPPRTTTARIKGETIAEWLAGQPARWLPSARKLEA